MSFFERVKAGSKRAGAALQTVVVTVLLFFTYVVGLGVTKLIALVVARRRLAMYHVGPPRDSYWVDVADEAPTDASLRRQY